MHNIKQNPLHEDLDYILDHTKDLWEELREQRIFITGGTGFFGCWLLESFLWANEFLKLGASATVLTRNPQAFVKKAPHLAAAPSVTLHQGDICDFVFPRGHFSHIIHAATEVNPSLSTHDPLYMFETIVQGTRHALDFSVHCGARKFLLTSSGAVYGKQPPEISHIPEDYSGAPDPLDPGSVYGEGKRAAELLCAIYSQKHKLECKIARCFSFVGPYMPIDKHFAIENFIKDAMEGRPITIKGDGTPFRSYLYAADLTIWLWKILVNGTSCRAYNVGSEESFTIREIAETVIKATDSKSKIDVKRRPLPGALPERYIPLTHRFRTEFEISNKYSLMESIRKTVGIA